MGQIAEVKSSVRMAKSGSAVKKTSSSSTKSSKKNTPNVTPIEKTSSLDFCSPKVQGVLLIGLLVVLAIALWFGFTHGCIQRRRRRRSTCY